MYADDNADDSGLGNSRSRDFRTSSPMNNIRSKYKELESKLETAICSNKQKQIAVSKLNSLNEENISKLSESELKISKMKELSVKKLEESELKISKMKELSVKKHEEIENLKKIIELNFRNNEIKYKELETKLAQVSAEKNKKELEYQKLSSDYQKSIQKLEQQVSVLSNSNENEEMDAHETSFQSVSQNCLNPKYFSCANPVNYGTDEVLNFLNM